MTDELNCHHCPLFGYYHTGKYTFLYECNYETIYRYINARHIRYRKQKQIEPLRRIRLALTTKELKKKCPRKRNGDKK